MRTSIALLVALFSIALLGRVAESKYQNPKNKVIVIIDNLAIRDTHSNYFDSLEERGYNLDFKVLSYDKIKLIEYGEYLYDHMILFCTSETDPRNFKDDKILDFFDNGRNLIIAGDVDTSKVYRVLFNALGADLDPYGTKVYDHVKAVSTHDHSTFLTSNFINERAIISSSKPIAFRGTAMTLTPYENHQIFPVIRGEQYSYARYDDADGKSRVLRNGRHSILVSAVQGRNNARIILSGSLDIFSNELNVLSDGANNAAIMDMTEWAFQVRGQIRVDSIFHHKANETVQPGEYKIYDDVVYEVKLSTFDAARDEWRPYVADDIQMEWVMLDPWIRMPITYHTRERKYIASFKSPDRHGVFHFKIIYRKPGYTFLNLATKIPVRPFKHDEYERYLFEASPYYFSVFATLFGFFIFVVFFLYTKDKSTVVDSGKKDQ